MADFDLNLLRVLVALDKTRNVSRAAEFLDMSQSGFSTALARLRGSTGDQLFVRTRNGMEATPRATAMISTARSVLDEVQAKILDLPAFDPTKAQTTFRLAMADVAEIVFLPRLLRHLAKAAPNVQLLSHPWPRGQLQEAMENGQVDIALGYFPDLSTDNVFKQRLYTHTYACILRKKHPAGARFSLSTYAELQHAVVNTPSRSDELFEHYLERKGMSRRIALKTPHHLSLPPIIAATDLVATVPLATATLFSQTGFVDVVPLPFAPPKFEVQQYWHRRNHNDPKVRWLQRTIAELFNDATDEWRAIENLLYKVKIRKQPR